jgi:arsenate reductase
MESLVISQLSTLAHPQRLALFRLLVRRYPDEVPAGEIALSLGAKPNTTSVYLAALVRAGLIRQHRYGTSLRYDVDLDATRGLVSDLLLDCCRGRPDLCSPVLDSSARKENMRPDRKYNVLFVCTGNSARSIFAEAILRHDAGDSFNAYSAGSRPFSGLNPCTLEVLRSRGIATEDLRAKTISMFREPDAPQFDFVFTVCDLAANDECAAWAGQPISAHWGLPDPVKASGTEAERRLAFQQTFGAMRKRIRAFAALPFDTLDRLSLQHHVDQIGKTLETT